MAPHGTARRRTAPPARHTAQHGAAHGNTAPHGVPHGAPHGNTATRRRTTCRTACRTAFFSQGQAEVAAGTCILNSAPQRGTAKQHPEWGCVSASRPGT
eukprot:gene8998-biopygen6078